MSVQIELDYGSFPKLCKDGENYFEWSIVWDKILQFEKVWDVVSGKECRPLADASAISDWDKKDRKALVLLITAVHPALIKRIGIAKTSAEAWASLSWRFDPDTVTSGFDLIRSLFGLQFDDKEDFLDHLDRFDELWEKVSRKCQSSKQPVIRNMQPLFRTDELKGVQFLTTLPNTMRNIVDDITSKDIVGYSLMKPKMLDIAWSRRSTSNGVITQF